MSKKRPSGTNEWAESSVNIQVGCEHRCAYCYANANAVRFQQVEHGCWGEPVIDPKKVERAYGKRKGTIMFPTTHDITGENLTEALTVLKKMLASGNQVLIVSKPHTWVVFQLVQELASYKDQILFRFSIGTWDDEMLSLWEPGAPSFTERFASLQMAHQHGFKTSISMEPLLETDEDAVIDLYETLAPYVTDSIWIGKANRLLERLKANGYDTLMYTVPAGDLIASQSDERILALYERMKDYSKVKWKESIKKVVGIEEPPEIGMDI